MKKLIVAGAALSAVAAGAMANEYDSQQAANTQVLRTLVSAIADSDPARIAVIDSLIDYVPDRRISSSMDPAEMVRHFARCTPAPLDTAQRFQDTTILKFGCPGRQVVGACSTGDLKIMVFHTPGPSVGVIEDQRNAPDCRPSAPPAPSRREEQK